MQRSETVEQPLVIPARVRRRGRRRRWLALALVAIAAIVAFILWRTGLEPGPVAYRTAPVELRTITKVVEAAGKLDVLTRIEIPSPEGGRVTELLVKAGDRITKDQPLARLDERATAIAVGSAQASVRAATSRISQAAAELAAATDTRERLERLIGKGLASPSELKQAESAESRARAALEVARADRSAAAQLLKSAELEKTQAAILAPLDGVVLRAPDAVGTTLDGSETLFVVGTTLDELRIDADVAESEIGQLKAGQLARFSVPAFPSRSFDAKVEAIAIDSDRTANAVRYGVQLRAHNPDRSLLPGMTATVRIEVARAENVLATREAALRFVPDNAEAAPPRSRVFRVESGAIRPIKVRVGLSDGAYTQITPEPADALRAGSEVALGVAISGQAKGTGGPGIKLGGR